MQNFFAEGDTMKQAVLFDLDGTLWDSTQQIIAPWNQLLQERGIDHIFTHEESCSCMGKTVDQIAAMLFPEIDAENGTQLVKDLCAAEVIALEKTGASPYPLLRETMLKLKEKYFLGIISNCEDGYIQAFLTAHDYWSIINDFECIGRTGRCKGDNIRLVMERNRIEQAIYVGDTASDHAAAQLAGIPFVHASYGFGQVDTEHKLSCIADIVEKSSELLP